MSHPIRLGLGLIGIGRPWGYSNNKRLPNEWEVEQLLHQALDLNITFFDTAPAYGMSEERLGRFLSMLSVSERASITVASKFGECWDHKNACSHVDHSYKCLCKTLDNSLKMLGKIDILQVHKANPVVLSSTDLQSALEYAKTKDVSSFGVSVSDCETALIACRDSRFSFIQFPFNKTRNELAPVFALVDQYKKEPIVNRPLNMGEMLLNDHSKERKHEVLAEAYKYIGKYCKKGVILTGTSSPEHLLENSDAFNASISKIT